MNVFLDFYNGIAGKYRVPPRRRWGLPVLIHLLLRVPGLRRRRDLMCLLNPRFYLSLRFDLFLGSRASDGWDVEYGVSRMFRESPVVVANNGGGFTAGGFNKTYFYFAGAAGFDSRLLRVSRLSRGGLVSGADSFAAVSLNRFVSRGGHPYFPPVSPGLMPHSFLPVSRVETEMWRFTAAFTESVVRHAGHYEHAGRDGRDGYDGHNGHTGLDIHSRYRRYEGDGVRTAHDRRNVQNIRHEHDVHDAHNAHNVHHEHNVHDVHHSHFPVTRFSHVEAGSLASRSGGFGGTFGTGDTGPSCIPGDPGTLRLHRSMETGAPAARVYTVHADHAAHAPHMVHAVQASRADYTDRTGHVGYVGNVEHAGNVGHMINVSNVSSMSNVSNVDGVSRTNPAKPFSDTGGVDIPRLTDQVYRMLERKIRTEKERRGW